MFEDSIVLLGHHGEHGGLCLRSDSRILCLGLRASGVEDLCLRSLVGLIPWDHRLWTRAPFKTRGHAYSPLQRAGDDSLRGTQHCT